MREGSLLVSEVTLWMTSDRQSVIINNTAAMCTPTEAVSEQDLISQGVARAMFSPHEGFQVSDFLIFKNIQAMSCGFVILSTNRLAQFDNGQRN